MSKSVKINNVTYENVPKVEVPLSAGDGNAVFWDTTGATGGGRLTYSRAKRYLAPAEL